jgi:hypothetical protein
MGKTVHYPELTLNRIDHPTANRFSFSAILDIIILMGPALQPNIWKRLAAPFLAEGRLNFWLVALFVAISGLVFYNVSTHNPRYGYDAEDHLVYLEKLTITHLVTVEETSEYFSPPLPYLVGAFAHNYAGMTPSKSARAALLANGVLSVGLLYFLLLVCLQIHPAPTLRIGTLLSLGILPVYYKTFSFVRGEPYLAFFAVLALYFSLRALLRSDWRMRTMLALGASLGMCALSRQWGFALFAAVGLCLAYAWFTCRPYRRAILIGTAACFALALALSGWFYASLYVRYGTITAFNRAAGVPSVSLANQPTTFYFGLAPEYIFSQPVRPNFNNQFWPVMYSETWGDYYAYFTVFGVDKNINTYLSGRNLEEALAADGIRNGWLSSNYAEIAPYLGVVNLVSLYPSLILLAALGYACWSALRRSPVDKRSLALVLLSLGITACLYGWFLLQYPDPRGTTIKASYVLQVFPCLALLAGLLLWRVQVKHPRLYLVLVGLLVLVWAIDLPAMLTRYISQ